MKIVFAFLVGLSWQPVAADTGDVRLACTSRRALLHNMLGKYQERPTSGGLTNGGVLAELLQSQDGKTWTIILSWPDGRSCLLAAGKDWQDRKPEINQGHEL